MFAWPAQKISGLDSQSKCQMCTLFRPPCWCPLEVHQHGGSIQGSKCLVNISTNIWSSGKRTDLKLGEVHYLFSLLIQNIFPFLIIISHNQLLFTKFEKNLRHIESMTSKEQPAEIIEPMTSKWRQKCSPLQIIEPLTKKTWGQGCVIFRKNKERNGETPSRTGKYFEWIIKQLLHSAFVGYEEFCRSRRLLSTSALASVDNTLGFGRLCRPVLIFFRNYAKIMLLSEHYALCYRNYATLILRKIKITSSLTLSILTLTRTTTWNVPGPSGTRDCINIVNLSHPSPPPSSVEDNTDVIHNQRQKTPKSLQTVILLGILPTRSTLHF